MEDEIDIIRRAVGQVMWTYFHILNTWADGMNANDLQRHTDEIVASISFAWAMISPELLQKFHTLVRRATPATSGMPAPPLDTLVTNIDTGIALRPSDMQRYFVSAVIPTVLSGLQAIAEDTLNQHFGNSRTIARRLKALRTARTIDVDLASEAHFWRIVRNVVTHGNGTISPDIEVQVQDLYAAGQITFTEFALWGPFLDARHGGGPVPLTLAMQAPPYAPGSPAQRTPARAGNHLQMGLGDVLACGRTWAKVLSAAT
jgi:hypothetical protein